jgi:meso-butanediol dehydrogenase/(S,S)-butanediol dehydrogenase/diacetyl reductase
MKLTGKTAIVSAAGRGIGKGIAISLGQEGATVIVNSFSEDTTQATVDEIVAAGGKAIAMPGDITAPEIIVDVVNKTIGEFGQIDILVNNVGAGPKTAEDPPDHPLGEVEGLWNALYRQNLLPVVLMTEAVLPHMKDRQYGKIVHISSIAGRSSFSPKMLTGFVHPSYNAMKAALINYTQTLADLVGADNINVNSVCPGIVYTDAWKGNAERAVKYMPDFKGMDPRKWFEGIFHDHYPDIFDRTPLKREQTVEDMGNAVKFLVTDDAMNITGQSLMVDGGMVKI